MPINIRSSRASQIVAWAVVSLFVLGFFIHQLGAWTGLILGVWFVGTQKPWRGFLWMMAFAIIPKLLFGWRSFPLTGTVHAFEYLGWILLVALLGVLPFTFHRLISARLPGLLSTLPLPLAGVLFHILLQSLRQTGATPGARLHTFLILWFAAVVVWMWNHESRAATVVQGAGIVLATGYELFRHISAFKLPESLVISTIFAWLCLGGMIVLSVWALLHPFKKKSWANQSQTIALLQSPFTGEPLHVVSDHGQEALVSSSGERFPIRNGIPAFLKPEDLDGDNLKYNHMYETIGGFYDDTQRVFCALGGFDRDAFFLGHLRLLEVKPGDSVLETSVGTGLNFKYLPRGVKLSGLDLSPEMLVNCQANLCRWELDADLYLGNAESLPFTDSSFDVVFRVGGINFFNDRAKAIREMIRVAKPGSLLLIADETEKHVKQVYEKGLGSYRNRREPVSPPIDLVPPEMQETHLEIGRTGEWYMLTFRKPAAGE